MTPWPDLLADALVGTDRRARPGAGVDAPGELLDRAGAWSVYARAGALAAAGVEPPPAAPLDRRDLVRPAAAARLAALTDAGTGPFDGGTRSALLAEWLGLVARHGRLVPPEFLPDLLDLGRLQSSLRPLIAAAGGARAGWLAQQNQDWSYASGAGAEPIADQSEWDGAARAQRVRYLRTRRGVDAPGARELLEEEWPTLGPDERAELIAVLAVGLEEGDEPLLERALDDRRAEVRATAAELLGQLPGSALNDRMAARTRASLSVEAGGRLAVHPPADYDPGMRRDGIVAKPPVGIGERAWWFQQVLARVPLDRVTTLGPGDFLALSIADDWGPIVRRGLVRAAVTQHDPSWAAALIDAVTGTDEAGLATALYPALGADELSRRALTALTAPAEDAADAWIPLLARCPAPWSDPLAAAALAVWERTAMAEPDGSAAAAEVAAARQLSRELDRLAVHAALSLPPAFADQVAAAVHRLVQAGASGSRVDPLARVASIVLFRNEMTMEIA